MGFPEYEDPVEVTQLGPGVMMVRPLSRSVSAGTDAESPAAEPDDDDCAECPGCEDCAPWRKPRDPQVNEGDPRW